MRPTLCMRSAQVRVSRFVVEILRGVYPERVRDSRSPALQHICPGGRCQGTQCGACVAQNDRRSAQDDIVEKVRSQ